MDLKQIQYIVTIAEENNITRAAEKLYITQSALNQQLLKLEKELGTQLFKRYKNELMPTEAGEIYLNAAKEILLIKKDTYNKIHDITETQQSELTVGFTPGRGIAMFSNVYPKFHRLHPYIQVTPKELSVQKQQELLTKGEIDIGFVTLVHSQQKSNLNYIPLTSEEILVATPKNHISVNFETKKVNNNNIPQIDLYDLRNESFVLTYKESTLRQITDYIFESAGFKPQVLFETSSNSTIATMVSSNLCCGLIPTYYARNCENEIQLFTLEGKPTWDVMACYNSKRYLSKAAKDFISLAKEFWEQNNSEV